MARSYVNRLGRFSSPDPISGSAADPQSLNRYAYVRNDPANAADPLGLVTDKEGPLGWLIYLGLGLQGRHQCLLDGVEMPCSFVFRLVESGNAAVLPSRLSPVGFYNGVPYQAVFDDDGFGLQALGGAAFYSKNGDPVRFLDLEAASIQGPIPGGGRDYKKDLAKLLQNPKCAALLGGTDEAQKQLRRAEILDLNYIPTDPNSIRAYQILVQHPYGAVYFNARIYVGGKFHELSGAAQNTVLIHELRHQAYALPEPLFPSTAYYDYIRKEFKNIAEKCNTEVPRPRR